MRETTKETAKETAIVQFVREELEIEALTSYEDIEELMGDDDLLLDIVQERKWAFEELEAGIADPEGWDELEDVLTWWLEVQGGRE